MKFYTVTFCGDDVIPFGTIFRSLDKAKAAASTDLQNLCDGEFEDEWVHDEFNDIWYNECYDVSYMIRAVEVEAE
jgi:hypothetical protein